tara:strand:- start:1147 stop:2448 length:1302 start_codon:yes stop_codon:yes gene_type:complete
MAYYLGRDVHASITTEHEICGIRVSGGTTYVDNVLFIGCATVTNGALGSASNIITCDGAHGLSDGDPVQIIMDGSAALVGANFDADDTYYAITFPNANKIALAATRSDAIGFTDSTADYNNGTTIEHDGAVTITAGMFVTHEPGSTGINDELYVASVTDGDTFVLSAATIGGNVTNQTLRFRKPIAFANNSGISDANIVRTLNGTSDTAFAEDSTQGTFIFNREYPTYAINNSTDIAEIVADNTASNAVPLQFASSTDRNRISDLVGVDVALNKVDEDIAYFGQRTGLKAEIKQGIEITFTRKKSDMRFAVLANSARHGLRSYTSTGKTVLDVDASTAIGSSTLPTAGTVVIEKGDVSDESSLHAINQNYGYRVHLQLKAGEEVIAIRNACIQDYNTTINPDGVTEESITFYSSVEPIFDDAPYATVTGASDI